MGDMISPSGIQIDTAAKMWHPETESGARRGFLWRQGITTVHADMIRHAELKAVE